MKRIAAAILLFALLVAAAAACVGWYYAGEIRREALDIDRGTPTFDLVVAGVDGGAITLRPSKASDRDHGDLRTSGRFGIESANGNGSVGEIVRRDGDDVTRDLLAFDAAIAEGDRVRLRAIAYSGDPLSAHGLAFEEVAFSSDIGELGAWYVAGSSDTWAIVVHGRANDRSEGLTLLPRLAALGVPALIIQYRNDEGIADSASGYYDYGLSEWSDLEAAVGYALDQGAKDVLLIGYSMGGAIAMNFLYRSELADRVGAVVLDSPVLDFGDVIDFGGERRNLPGFLTGLGKFASTFRSGVAWRDLDYLKRADELDVPILLFHGDADRTVHVRTSDRLAAARPDLVTYVRFEETGHVRGWNTDPQAYERALTDFLTAQIDDTNAARAVR